MVQLNLALREINCKIVYFGCGLGGKTTNLEVVHQKADQDSRGELTSIATESDRTLFFDFMPLDLGEVSGMKVKFQLYTVPGQVYYNSTRKLVLRGADAVIFIADSQRSKMEENIESLENLAECLVEQGRSLEEMPHVIQYNKRDLEDIYTVDEMNAQLNKFGAPFFEGVASSGEGVTETLKKAAAMLLERVKAMSTESATKPDVKAHRNAAAVRTPMEHRRAKTDQERLQGGLSSHRTTGAQEVVPNSSKTPLGAVSFDTDLRSQSPTAPSPIAPTSTKVSQAVKPSLRQPRSSAPMSSGAPQPMMVVSGGRRAKQRAPFPTVAVLSTFAVCAAGAAAWVFLLS